MIWFNTAPMKTLLLVAVFSLIGCVSPGAHQKLRADHDALRAQLDERDAAYRSCQTLLATKEKEVDRVKKGWMLVPVVVAAQDIPEGTTVTFEMIAQRSVPEQFVTSSVVKPDSASYIVNQKVLVPLQAGDPLLWSQFETTKAAERLSDRIPAEMRLFTVEASPIRGVGGWIRPNDYVDVIAVPRAGAPAGKEPKATTVVEYVKVLATGKITSTTNLNLLPENQRGYSDVTLVVTPRQAEKLAAASTRNELMLSLRAKPAESAPTGK